MRKREDAAKAAIMHARWAAMRRRRMKTYPVLRRTVAVALSEALMAGSFYAIDDTCTHRGGPLSEGEVSGEEVTCPWHGAIYNIKTGAVLGPPAPRGVARYAVRVQGSDVEVEV